MRHAVRMFSVVPVLLALVLVGCDRNAPTPPAQPDLSPSLQVQAQAAAEPFYRVFHPDDYEAHGIVLPSFSELMAAGQVFSSPGESTTVSSSDCDPDEAIIECPQPPGPSDPSKHPEYAYGSTIYDNGVVDGLKRVTMYSFSEAKGRVDATVLDARFDRDWATHGCDYTNISEFDADYRTGSGSPHMLEASRVFEWTGPKVLRVRGTHVFDPTHEEDAHFHTSNAGHCG